MDNLTHTLTGLLMSRAGLNRFHPRATLLLVLGANAPDIDAISMAWGAGAYLHYHRWWTHALIAIPVVAVLPLLFVRQQRLRAWGLAFAGVASHLLLDWTNAYGIRLWLPWSDAWPGLDITSVVDLWIWTILLIATLWPMLARLVGSEIGERRRGTPGRGLAIVALVLLLCYDGARYVLKQRAITVQEARLYDGQTPRRVLVAPTPVNPFRWRGFVETDTFWAVHEVDLLDEFDPASGQVHYKVTPSAAIEAARQTIAFQRFLAFSKAPQWQISPDPEAGTRVDAVDLRFGFSATAHLDPSGRVERASVQF